MTKFSDKLIKETIENFKEEDNLDINENDASEYLKSLAGLYLAFKK